MECDQKAVSHLKELHGWMDQQQSGIGKDVGHENTDVSPSTAPFPRSHGSSHGMPVYRHAAPDLP